MVDGGSEFIFFWGIYPCKNWCKNWYLHFHKTYKPQIWQADTFTGVESNDSIPAGAGDAITSIPRDKLKTYLYYQSPIGNQIWLDSNLPDCLLPMKSHDPLITLPYILKLLYLHYHDAYCHQAWQGCNLSWGDPMHKVIWQFNHVTS